MCEGGTQRNTLFSLISRPLQPQSDPRLKTNKKQNIEGKNVASEEMGKK